MTVGEMVAGRELDALVAEKVMGLSPCHFAMRGAIGMNTVWQCQHADQTPDFSRNCFDATGELGPHRYSTAIAAAWEVVEKFQHDGWAVEVDWCPAHEQGPCWFSELSKTGPDYYRDHADTAPLAICFAALEAINHA